MKTVLRAPAPDVFKACTEPDRLAEWWGPRGFTCPSIEVDLRVGGRYRIAMQPPDGELFHLTGEFVAVEPPAHLAYTFRWEEPDPDDRETAVRLSLADLGGSTELTLDHGPFATEARLAVHRQGWADGFDRLEELLARPEAEDPEEELFPAGENAPRTAGPGSGEEYPAGVETDEGQRPDEKLADGQPGMADDPPRAD